MKVLSANLQAIINTHPVDTILRRQHTEEDKGIHEKLLKSSDDPDPSIKVPNTFDGRKVWSGLLTPVTNQGTCGSCWAFSSVSTLADRFNIQSMGLLHVVLSAAKLILCDINNTDDIHHPEIEKEKVARIQHGFNKDSACFGNTLVSAWTYLFEIGSPPERCVPYHKRYGLFNELDELGSFMTEESMPTCVHATGILGDMCSDFTYNEKNAEETGTPSRFYKALHFYAIAGVPEDGGSEYFIRYNIFKWGPVSTSFAVYPDFYTYDSKNTIYEHVNNEDEQVGGHAVEIVGWGEENNKKYWIIKNSWGIEWGDKGFFRMIRGTNNCQIEENVITGVPDYFYPLDFDISSKGLIWTETEKSIQRRKKYSEDRTIEGGGIDPTIGYSRRVISTMPWVNFNRPLDLDYLPNHKHWIAGIDANEQNRLKYSILIQSKKRDIDYAREGIFTVTIILGILVTFLIIVIIIYFFKKIKVHHPNN